MKITELSKKKAVPSRQRDPGALATRSHIASQEKRHADWAEKQRELQKQFYANHPELADTKGTTEGSVNKKPQPYNDPNWIKNLPKEKLDALAGPRYTKRPKKNKAEPGVTEGEIVPFKRPQAITWQKLPKDVLSLANDWFWTDYEGGGLAATMDPKGLGSGLANQQKYLGAQLQQRGWAIDIDDEFENVVLKNKQGQTILLPIDDAQTFSGWAAGTNPVKEQGVAESMNEMDKSAPQPGRDGKISHSTYGSRDKKGSDYFKGKEAPGKPITKKQAAKDALDILKKQGVAEVSDETLTSYLSKVDADARKHPSDPTKRPAPKRNKSVAGFSRAFNKLDARKAQDLAPRVGESTEEDKATYERAARDVVKGADPDHIARVRKLDPEILRQHVAYAWERVNRGEYRLNRPDLEETNLRSVVDAQQGGMPLANVTESRESCPECGGPMFPALILGEKQDACYYKVKSRYKVWPSAYASGALVQCRKKGAANWGNKGK